MSHWAGGAFTMTAIWAVSSLLAGEWKTYWPAAPIGIWAAVLISYALWPDNTHHHNDDGDSADGIRDTTAK